MVESCKDGNHPHILGPYGTTQMLLLVFQLVLNTKLSCSK